MKAPLKLFIGPCVLESEQLALEIAESLVEQLRPFDKRVSLVFKGSFDKANRTSINSKRGQGMETGLSILQKVKERYQLPLLTDFHLPDQAMRVAEVVDILQIPAFLCRQTDMILEGARAAAKYNRQLKIKKGQFLSPQDAKNIVEKAHTLLPKERIMLTERGTSFGYNNLIVDMASFSIMKSFGVQVIYDATHSIQMPGGLGNITGGKREQMLVLAKAALAAGADGIFMEVHPIPEQAWSDPTTCQPLSQVRNIVSELLKIYEVV